MRLLVIAAVALAAIALAGIAWGKRHARRLQRERHIRIDRYKLKRRYRAVEREVLGDPEVAGTMEAYAREHRVSVGEAERLARRYLLEIVPKFNLLAYYRIGAPVAKAIMHLLYRVVVELKPIREFSERHRGAVSVYMINHRSNADYVLVAHMLFKFISLSYAIGEWARIWPLNHLFKWFGGYFVRRRYREPLYHAVLSKYVQTITMHGVTQGVFLEGGLSRDGAFQKPKLGMLDYIVTAKRNVDFTAPLFIIPTAVNYDRVLEDRVLTEELMGKEERSTRSEKLRATFDFLFRNLWRSIAGRFKRYGYAIVAFGTPISVDAFIRDHPAVLAPSFEQRKPDVQRLAAMVMNSIAASMPVTPVTLVAHLFAHHPKAMSDSEIAAGLDELMRAWQGRVWMLREKRGSEVWLAARRVLELRGLVKPVERWRDDLFDRGGIPTIEDAWEWTPEELLLRDYYANALRTDR